MKDQGGDQRRDSNLGMASFSSISNANLNVADLPAVIFNAQGEIIDFSKAICQVTGCSSSELKQMTIAELISQQVYRELQLFRGESEQERQADASQIGRANRQLQGQQPVWGLSLYPREQVGEFVLYLDDGVANNKSADHKQQDLRDFYQQQRLSEIGVMTSGIAHEINNPITGIINYAQLIMQRTTEPMLKEFASEIVKEGQRVSHLVRNLLNYARNDGDEFQVVMPVEIVEDSVNLMHPILRKDDISVRIETDQALPHVRCIPQRICQVLINLLSNARHALNLRYPKYHPNKRIVINLNTLTEEDAAWLRIKVIDFGTGIAPEIGARLFEPFFTTRRNSGGTGLGLALCQMIAAEHHGRLSYSSQVEEYTQFCLDLPLKSSP